MRFIDICDIKTIYHKVLHIESEVIYLTLFNGESMQVSPLLMERSLKNGFGLNVDSRFVLRYDVLLHIKNYIEN